MEGIAVITGKQGDGKTYYAVGRMIEELSYGRVVYSNVKLIWPEVAKILSGMGLTVPATNYRHLSEEQMVNWHREINTDCAVFLDEVQLYYNSRYYKATHERQREMLEFIPQARKNGCLIAFITQHESNVDTQFLRQTSRYYRCKNLLRHPWVKTFFPFAVGIVNITGPDGKTCDDRDWVKFGKYYKCYDTRQTYRAFEMSGAPAAAVTGKRKGSPWAAILLSLSIAFAGIGYWIDSQKKPEPVPVVAAPSLKPNPSVYVPPLPAPVSGTLHLPVSDPNDLYPVVVRRYGSSSTVGSSADGLHWLPSIVLDSGRVLRKGSWLDGVIVSWLWVTPEVCLMAVNDPFTNTNKTIKLYDHKLSGSERSSTSNYNKPAPVVRQSSSEGRTKSVPVNSEGFDELTEKYMKK